MVPLFSQPNTVGRQLHGAHGPYGVGQAWGQTLAVPYAAGGCLYRNTPMGTRPSILKREGHWTFRFAWRSNCESVSESIV